MIEVRFKIQTDFAKVATDIEGFRADFKKGVANAAGVSEDRIVIENIEKGSIIVNFFILEGSSSGESASSMAVTTFKDKINAGTVNWSDSLADVMAGGAAVEATATRTMSKESLQALTVPSSVTVMLSPLDGWSPPSGCECVLATGITDGCAGHKDIWPPWCLADASCPISEDGSWGKFVWCVDAAARAPSPADDPSNLNYRGANGALCLKVGIVSLVAALQAFA